MKSLTSEEFSALLNINAEIQLNKLGIKHSFNSNGIRTREFEDIEIQGTLILNPEKKTIIKFKDSCIIHNLEVRYNVIDLKLECDVTNINITGLENNLEILGNCKMLEINSQFISLDIYGSIEEIVINKSVNYFKIIANREGSNNIVINSLEINKTVNISNLSIIGEIDIQKIELEETKINSVKIKCRNISTFLIRKSNLQDFRIDGSCILSNFRLVDNTTIYYFSMNEQSKIINTLSLKINSIINNLYINESSNIEKIIPYKDSLIENLSLNDFASIGHLELSGKINDIRILNYSLIDSINLHNTISKLLINGTLNNFKLNNNSNVNIIKVESGYCKEFIIVGEIDTLSIVENSFIGQIIIYNKVKKLDIDNSKIGFLSSFNKSTNSSILIDNNSKIFDLFFTSQNFSTVELIITNSKINSIEFQNLNINENSIVRLSDIVINKLEIDNLNNLGTIFFANLSSYDKIISLKKSYESHYEYDRNNRFIEIEESLESKLSIVNSNLNSTHFINIDLSKFKRTEFINSKILDCFFAEVKLPNSNQIVILKTDKNIDLNNQKRLFFGQIKSLYERQGDVARAGEAQALEYYSYQQQIKNINKLSRKINFITADKTSNKYINYIIEFLFNKEAWNYRKERIVLFVNRWSSNYGTNWLRAAFTTLSFTILAFTTYCLLVGYKISFSDIDWSKTFELASHTLSYLNPFRDEDTSELVQLIKSDCENGTLNRVFFDSKPSQIIPPFARLWDYISRIVIAFLVYQTIAAFRRLGKSNG